MRTLNLEILAHVDAGKTSLTERLLYSAGVIDEVGSVDDGSAQADTLAPEQERGIKIKSDVVSFVDHYVAINPIYTSGHPDFITEVRTDHKPLDREECLLRGGSSRREIFIHGRQQHAFR